MTHGLSDFEEQLGRELRAAAYRRIEARDSRAPSRRAYPIVLGALAAVVVVAVAAVVISEVRPQPVAAHPFKIIYLEHEIRLEIVDLVEDPRGAEQKLGEELGIDIEFVAVPTPPELLNEVGGAFGSGTTTIGVEFDEAGRSESITLPQVIDGKLSILYGRDALPGEPYHFTVTSPQCGELWDQTPQESVERLDGLAGTVRYDTYDSDYRFTSEVPFTEIDPDYRLIDTMFLSDDKLLVVFSAHLDALGNNRPNCGWSAP